MGFLTAYLKQRRKGIGVLCLFCLIFFAIFGLYRLPLEAVLYPALVCVVLGVIFLIWDFYRARNKHLQLQKMKKLSPPVMDTFPPARTLEDEDYQQIIQSLCQAYREMEDGMKLRYSEMMDYYAIWAHQIKTPIASMRLNLENEDSPLAARILDDLFRIEQYVEMVLMFLRLDSDTTDYVLREYDLDHIVRGAVKKFAGQFIRGKIRLEYRPFNTRVLTDEKWLSFVIEQVLSNALKYTPSGSIAIRLEEPKTLCIRDTGIGIAPEDLPRIFEKGYTGYNGRSDKKASGIGLYLCRRICRNLGHDITADSAPDRGTEIRIVLEHRRLEVE